MTAGELNDLLSLAQRLADEAGDLIRSGRARGITDVETKSSGTDMVTEFDRASEALIVGTLRRERAADAIVGEEGTEDSGTSGVTWFIDPIDGTTNFLYGLPGYAVSIAAADSEGPLVAAVTAPGFGETFTAVRGRGSWCNGVRLHCSEETNLAEALVATGFSYAAERRRRQAAVVERIIGEVRDIRRLGAASVDLCFVGAGRVDAYFEVGLQAWDSAAGLLVASEAGARSADLAGGAVRPDNVLVAAPGVFEELQMLLVDAGAADV